MRAVVKREPAPGTAVMEVPIPEVKSHDVLIRVEKAGICGSDVHMDEWTGQGYEWMPLPLIMGHEFSGEVAELGKNVKNIEVGDMVSATPHIYCGSCRFCKTGRFNLCLNRALKIGFTRDGGFAEYVSVPEECVYKLPANASFEMGALVEPLCVALHGVEVVSPELGDTVAILGAGPIALLMTQVVKRAGVGTVMVTGLAKDETRLVLAKSLGADVTVNVDREDPVAMARQLTGELGVDIVYELSGSPSAFRQGLKMLRRGGRMAMIGLSMGSGEITPISDAVRGEITLQGSFNYVPSTWNRAIGLLEQEMIDLQSLVSHRLPLEKAAEGFELARKGEAIKVLLTP